MLLFDVLFMRVGWRLFRLWLWLFGQTHIFLVNKWLVITDLSEKLELGLFVGISSQLYHFVFFLDLLHLRVDQILSHLIFFHFFFKDFVLFFIIFIVVDWPCISVSQHAHCNHHGWSLDLALRVSGVFPVLMLPSLFDFELFFDHFFDLYKFFFLGINLLSVSNLLWLESLFIHSLIERV